MRILVAAAALASTAAAAGTWWSPGEPTADPAAIVTVGGARFTVLTDALLRLEYGNGASGDGQTSVVWNRRLPVPAFTTRRLSPAGVVITTGSLNLTYTGDGSAPLSSADTRVELLRPSFAAPASAVWRPGMDPNLDGGNLRGTFHTLDTLGGWQDLNCSALDASFEQADFLPYYPCVPGLVSTSGWSMLDDSRSPVITPEPWLATRPDGSCQPNATRTPCALGSWGQGDAASCEAAGCCWAYSPPPPVLLSLFYSPTREDHFTDATCAGCSGFDYTLVRSQGQALVSGDGVQGAIPLNLYWNADPAVPLLRGATGDNVVSTAPPAQPGYTFVRVQGYIYNESRFVPPGVPSHAVRLFYSTARLDHFTTMSDADEADAAAGGYSLVATLGFIATPAAPLPPSAGPSCFTKGGSQDLYLFGHGADYASALRDFTAIAGAIPIPRKHWLGMSWSRWGNELVQDVMVSEVTNLTAAGFPLSSYILDMNWHEKPDWTGYSWDAAAYPNHTALLAWLHSLGVATALNLHDAEGVMPFEGAYAAMAAAVGVDPASNATIAFDVSNQTFTEALHRTVLQPLADGGVDFWWTDFQQGLPGMTHVSGVTPTWLLNHVRFMNHSQPGSRVRGLTHSRFPGWGGHRYPSGFGGDVIQTWESLPFMVFFTATATNVAFAWWGHEMMRDGGSPDDNTELFTRVQQFGAWSPVYTNWGNSGSDDNLWNMDATSQAAVRGALMDRAQTLPYRYTLAKVAHDTGLGPVCPMYYGWPFAAAAYGPTAAGQYMMGDALLVAPVGVPADPSTGLASSAMWLPPGTTWMDFYQSGTVYGGGPAGGPGAVLNRSVPLHVTPVLVAAGAILPLSPFAEAGRVGAAGRQYAALQFSVFPPAAAPRSGGAAVAFPPPPGTLAAAWVYEDDGVSNDYLTSLWANTSVSASTGVDGCMTVTVATAGGYPTMPPQRDVSVWLKGSTCAPTTVSSDGAALPSSPTDGMPGSWWRDASAGPAPVDTRVYLLPGRPTSAPTALIVCW